MSADNNKILVIGGGMSGLTAALEAAECRGPGHHHRKGPLPGRPGSSTPPIFPQALPAHLRSGDQFPPDRENPNITFYTMAEVTQVSGGAGDFEVTVKRPAPLCQRPLRGLQCLRGSLHRAGGSMISTTAWTRPKRPTSPLTWPSPRSTSSTSRPAREIAARSAWRPAV